MRPDVVVQTPEAVALLVELAGIAAKRESREVEAEEGFDKAVVG